MYLARVSAYSQCNCFVLQMGLIEPGNIAFDLVLIGIPGTAVSALWRVAGFRAWDGAARFGDRSMSSIIT